MLAVTSDGEVIAGLTATVAPTAGTPTWVTATLSATNTPAELTLQAQAATLPSGTYEATVALASADVEVVPETLTVTLTVRDSLQIQVVPGTVPLEVHIGEAPPTAEVAVTSVAVVDRLEATVSYASAGSNWLTATLEASTTPTMLRLETSPASLAAGQYEAVVRIGAPGAIPVALAVQLQLRPPVSPGLPEGPVDNAMAQMPASWTFVPVPSGLTDADNTGMTGVLVNNRGVVVGTRNGQLVAWNSRTGNETILPGGDLVAINDRNEILINTPAGAIVWTKQYITSIPAQAGISRGVDLNNRGNVAGYDGTGPFLWTATAGLARLTGASPPDVLVAMNGRDEILGTRAGGTELVLWQPGGNTTTLGPVVRPCPAYFADNTVSCTLRAIGVDNAGTAGGTILKPFGVMPDEQKGFLLDASGLLLVEQGSSYTYATAYTDSGILPLQSLASQVCALFAATTFRPLFQELGATWYTSGASRNGHLIAFGFTSPFMPPTTNALSYGMLVPAPGGPMDGEAMDVAEID